MALSFAFDPSKGETPETIARQRAIAEALLANIGAPDTYGEGIQAMFSGIASGIMANRAKKGEAAGREGAASAFKSLLGGGFGGTPSTAATSAGGGSAPSGGSGVAAADLAPHQRALLETISGPESGGRYDVIYGGERFKDFSDHPRKAIRIQTGPNAGRTSSAAGKYQFLGSTWDQYKDKLGLADFSPENQDRAAWALAADTYRQKTGQDLDAVLQSGDPEAIANVGSTLRGVWTSLPGGIEQGTNKNKFVSTFMSALQRHPAGQETASLDPNALAAGSVGRDPMGGAPAVERIAAALVRPTDKGLRANPQQTAALLNPETAMPPQPLAPMPANPGAPQGPGQLGEVRQGADGQTYQYAETSGMQGASGPQGWIRYNGGPAPEMAGEAMAGASEGFPPAPAPPQMAQAQQMPELAGNVMSDAGPGGPSMQQLMEFGANPWASDSQRGIVELLLKQQLGEQATARERASPEYQLEMEIKRAQLAKAKAGEVPAGVQELQWRAQQAGLTPGTPEYQKFMVAGGKGPLVVNNLGGNSNKFLEESDKKASERLGEITTAGGPNATEFLGQIEQLADMGRMIGTGKTAEFKAAIGPYAEALGVPIEGLGDLQAYEGIVARLAPQMRQAGSGASSDFDAKQFLLSLPRIGNTTEGNQLIADTFQAVYQNRIQAAEIAGLAYLPPEQGGITWQEAEKRIRALENPYAKFKEYRKGAGKADALKATKDRYGLQ